MNQVINQNDQSHFPEWKGYEKHLFRFFFIFLVIQIIPLDWKFYHQLFSINWLNLNFYDLFELAKYQPAIFIANDAENWYNGSFLNWILFAVIAAIGALIWGRLDSNRKEYTVLYYWLRALVRYRLAFVLIAYGFVKFFPLQMPYPSLSNLLTNYGDYHAWKIYFQTVGIAPKYESFLGFVEILAAFLIFYRRTVTFGVGLIFGFLGNVAVANGFYDIGEPVLSTFIVLLSAFLFVYDVPRLYDLLIKEVPARANKFVYRFSGKQRSLRYFGRAAFILFTVLFAWKTYDNYVHEPYKLPKTRGLDKAYGFYQVKEFVLNNDTIPYSKTDSSRWQDVIFERWSTLTIKVNRPVKIDLSNGEGYHEKDIDRNYELAGFAGRHYFHYEADTVNHTLSLQNKNKNHRSERLQLKYERPNDSTILLSGINENRDSIRVVLSKINKKYMMFEGRRKPVKI